MDGLQSRKKAWQTAWFHSACRQMLSVTPGAACLLLLSGCAFSRNMLNGPTPAAAPPAAVCTNPDCAAPNTATTAAAMTAMPAAQAVPAASQAGVQAPPAQMAGQVPAYGPAAAVTPAVVPHVPQPFAPPGWKLVPDPSPAVPPSGFMTEERLRQQGESLDDAKGLAGPPIEWPVDEKLLRCERQVAEMTEKIMGLQNVTEVTKQAMLSMELEQLRLRNENETLKRRADESHREVIKSIDSLSEFMDGIVPAAATPQKPTSTGSVKRAAKPAEQTSVLPPVDDEL
jgi:hypothetical protein